MTCDANSCTVREPRLGLYDRIDIADIADQESSYDTARAVLTKNGITLLEVRGGTGGPNFRTYGAWLEHGAFSVGTKAQTEVEGVTITVRGAAALGDLTNTRPSTNATWRGLMVGTPSRGAQRDNLLQGDAQLTFDASESEIDATFSNIVDLDRNAAHSVREVRFKDVPVSPNGTWTVGSSGNTLSGGFVGPDHSEAGGIFEQQGIVGAYGAKR